MIKFEAVRVLSTLKFGDTVYQGGKVYYQPLPPDILKEVAIGSPHIEVIAKLGVVEEPMKAQPEIPEEDEIPKEDEKPKSTRKLVRRSA